MPIQELAKDFTELCRQQKNLEAVDKYYADDIVSVESMAGPDGSKETKGIQAIRGKNQWWVENHEVHSAEANGPFVGENQFALEFTYDVTNKPSGQRMQLNEMALYTVKNNKIVREHFYYNMGA